MKACGIVAEYNPLHTGHIYQMNKARQISQADCIIVVMSGNFVQRGEPAVIDKYARTSAALKAGADIVVELPVYYALSSAENFAKGAVLTLNTMKSASICFGAETDNADCLAKISRTIISESPEYKAILNRALAEGLSYPAARQTALLEYLPECKDIITGSNNILAIEYIKAILYNNLNMTYYPVLREGAGYNDDTDTAEYASAFGIRKMLMSDEHDRLKTYLTAGMYEEISNSKICPLFLDDFSNIFNHKMLFIKQICNINNTDFADRLAEYEDISFNKVLDDGNRGHKRDVSENSDNTNEIKELLEETPEYSRTDNDIESEYKQTMTVGEIDEESGDVVDDSVSEDEDYGFDDNSDDM